MLYIYIDKCLIYSIFLAMFDFVANIYIKAISFWLGLKCITKIRNKGFLLSLSDH